MLTTPNRPLRRNEDSEVRRPVFSPDSLPGVGVEGTGGSTVGRDPPETGERWSGVDLNGGPHPARASPGKCPTIPTNYRAIVPGSTQYPVEVRPTVEIVTLGKRRRGGGGKI